MSVLSSDDISSENMYGLHKYNKCALKLLGIDAETNSEEEVLEFLSEHLSPESISALMFDSHNNFYILFLLDIESVCKIVGKKLIFGDRKVKILPLLDFYLVYNVHPSLTNEDLADIFRFFGNVYEVKNYKLLPNSPKFSHVLSGKRELSFLLPGKERNVGVPGNVIRLPFTFHVKKLCCACLTEGHSILFCPDIEDCNDSAKMPISPCISDDDSDEISAIIAENKLLSHFKEEIDPGCSSVPDYGTSEDLNTIDKIKFPDEVEKIVENLKGCLPKNALKRLMLMDGRNKKSIKNFIFKYTSDFGEISKQLDKINNYVFKNKTVSQEQYIKKIKQLKNTVDKMIRRRNKMIFEHIC